MRSHQPLLLLCLTAATAHSAPWNDDKKGPLPVGVPPSNPFKVPAFTPSGFLEAYNTTYCPANTTQVDVPPIIAYYPYPAIDVFDIVGDYFNITWIDANYTYTFSGQDNVPYSALRQQTNDPFASAEILTHYYKGYTQPYGFYHQQIAKVYTPDLVAPGLLEPDSRPEFILRPACHQKAAQFGWYFGFCFTEDTASAPSGFDLQTAIDGFVTALSAGATGALVNVWNDLEAKFKHQPTAFNSTTDCKDVRKYNRGH